MALNTISYPNHGPPRGRHQYRRMQNTNVSFGLDVGGWSARQYTARFCFVALLASENRGSAGPPSNICCATYSPNAGPCLNPCPEPPPANQTLFASGCRSIKKSPFEVFSYWHTRVSTMGAFARAGKRFATYSRTCSTDAAETTRDCVSGSTRSPWLSKALLKPRDSRSGMPYTSSD